MPSRSSEIGRPPTVRDADFSSKWKVPHWKSVNTTAFAGTEPESVYFYITDEWATTLPRCTLDALTYSGAHYSVAFMMCSRSRRCLDGSDGRDLDSAGAESCLGLS
jgi:hypothetical protein